MQRLLPHLLLAFACTAAAADEKKPDPALVDQLRAFLAEEGPGARAVKGVQLAVSGRTAAEIEAALPHAWTWPPDAPQGDVAVWKRESEGGAAHTIFANIPASYDPKKPAPVLIWLHGAVSRPTDGGGLSGIQLLKTRSDEEGILLLSPSTHQGAEWWTPKGVALVRAALADLKKRWRVDAGRVAVSGFSDGASGCFHLLAHDPEPYCCFMPLMGQPGVTRLVGGPSFAVNVRSRPVFAVNGGQDALYPSAQVKPMIADLEAAGCDITWTDMPDTGHNIAAALPAQWGRMLEFFSAARPSTSVRETVAWETALPDAEGRFEWVEILAVAAAAPSHPALDHAAVLSDPAGRPKLGIQIDPAWRGQGLRIREVQEDTPAFEAGIEVGDVIVAVDGKDLGKGREAFAGLRKALDGLKGRDGVFRILRGQDELEVKTRPRVVASTVERPPDRGYGRPSGRIEASIEGNLIRVRTRHVKQLKLHLTHDLLDLTKPIRVLLNDKLRYDAVVPDDIGYLLTEAVRGGPGAPVYRSALTLRP